VRLGVTPSPYKRHSTKHVIVGRLCRVVCIIGSWAAKDMAEIEALIHTEAGIVVPEI